MTEHKTNPWILAGRVVALIGLLYCFLLSIQCLSLSFKMFGEGYAEGLFNSVTKNPFLGLLIGIFATSLVQSSSVTTSTVVGLVAGGAMPIGQAIPIVMGANLGTTVTNMLVSLGHISRRDEFRRAFAGATVHDFFNVLTLLILFPLEMTTHFLEKSAKFLCGGAADLAGNSFHSPVKAIVKPVANQVKELIEALAPNSDKLAGTLMLIFSAILIFGALTFMVKVLRKLLVERVEAMVDRSVGRRNLLDNGLVGMGLGATITTLVQSSSITTSIMVPLIGAGVVTLPQVFAVTLGANVGTTVTALLASSAANQAGLQIAIVHLLFNLAGIALIYPIPVIRRIPMRMAQTLANISAMHRWVPFVFIAVVFFLIPGVCVYLFAG